MSATKRNFVTSRLVSIVSRDGDEVTYNAQKALLLHQSMSERRLEQALRDETECRQAIERILKAQRYEPPAATRHVLPPLPHELSARLLKAVIGIGLVALLILAVLTVGGWK